MEDGSISRLGAKEKGEGELDLIHGLRLILFNKSTVVGSVLLSFHLKTEGVGCLT